MSGHIYLLKEREFIKTYEDVYKIGKTKQDFNKRCSSYPKETIVYLQLYVEDVDNFEKTLIDLLPSKCKKRSDIGNEYFEGDKDDIIKIIYSIRYNEEYTNLFELDKDLKKTVEENIKIKTEKIKESKEKHEKMRETKEKPEEKIKKISKKIIYEMDKKIKKIFIHKKIPKKIIDEMDKKIKKIFTKPKNIVMIKGYNTIIKEFLSESIVKTDDPTAKISKMGLICGFKCWFELNYGTTHKKPKNAELFIIMDETFGKMEDNKWKGVSFVNKYEEEDIVGNL